MPENVNENRPKRIRKTLFRLKRSNRSLREVARRYRRVSLGMAGLAVIAVTILGFVMASDSSNDAILLGEGPAGIHADSVTTAEGEPARESSAGRGEASYYGEELAGQPTASGEAFNPEGLTAAHRTLPIGTQVRVTNVDNGRSVVVRINDRGPFAGHRVIDLSAGAARRIGMLGAGTAMVRLHVLDQ